MEIFKLSAPSSIPIFTPKPSIQFPGNSSYKFRKSHSKPYLYRFPLPCCSRFHISAHLIRRSSRRNSLRKKLLVKVPTGPTLENDDTHTTQSNLGTSGREASVESVSVHQIDSQVGHFVKGQVAGESVLWNKLEGWVEQYKNDIEFWGLGSAPIFTVYQDLDGNVNRVLVDEDEIVRRSQILPSQSGEERELEQFGEVSSKISHARFLAKEMETGNNVLPKSSSVVKFVVSKDSWRLVSGIRNGVMRFGSVPNVSRFGIVPLCGLLLVWAVKKYLSRGGGEKELTRLEKEMVRRKMNSRKKKETFKDGSVEVVPELIVPATELVERPHLDKEELMSSIRTAMQSNNEMKMLDAASTTDTDSLDFENRIQEIREMAKHAREVESREHSSNEEPLIEVEAMNELLDAPEVASDIVVGERGDQLLPTHSTSKVEQNSQFEREDSQGYSEVLEMNGSGTSIGQSSFSKEAYRKKPRVIRSVTEAREYLSDKQPQEAVLERGIAFAEVGEDTKITSDNATERLGEEDTVSDASDLYSPPNIIPSTKSRSYSRPRINGLNGKAQNTSVITASASAHDLAKDEVSTVDTKKKVGKEEKTTGTFMPDRSIGASESVVSEEVRHDSSLKEDDRMRTEINGVSIDTHSSAFQSAAFHNSSFHEDANCSSQSSDHQKEISDIGKSAGLGESDSIPAVNAFDVSELNIHVHSDENQAIDEVFTAENSEVGEENEEKLTTETSLWKNNWLEKNFDELLPVLEKMGSGFTDNYMMAREKLKQQDLDRGSDITQVVSALKDNTELEWMDDENLREIVLKVRDNEVAGRDPFHSMDDEDKVTFFKGLEEKVEKESEKLSALHEWLHSNIENLDYGADGISVYDPPEKIIPRWKGAPFEKIREFLANAPKAQEALDKITNSPNQENLPMNPEARNNDVKPLIKVAKKSTVIESSDGSVKAGKRTGKEQWQHTKKHSRGFLESYNAETDPEIKELMKDMGKDLDRWITEDEVKKAANLVGKFPRRRKAFVEKRISKLKSEVERFGTQAVLNKYREYAVEEETDYLWWLDLPYVLCIELYTREGDEMKVGFYTLEMAADLELEPKPYHVIAFEDPGECKNLCYIIQSHLEMLGKDDKAFVVAQPPKDAFRDSKANDIAVTVIRKGELQLNVDQPLEEVEELITEIGSKMYHDKITKERSVDIRSVMKGVLATSKPQKRKNVKRRGLGKPKN